MYVPFVSLNLEENMKDILKDFATKQGNIKWENAIKREKELYHRKEDLRSDFERDYNRIINTTGYRRMKHKTQVFFSPKNDHICTRIIDKGTELLSSMFEKSKRYMIRNSI